ncbi:MAG: hypothetical protein HY736_01425 [Verrucomicrobia bacterium]|nr:hypothetical protein [Verrucomicrobiota bacterium]
MRLRRIRARFSNGNCPPASLYGSLKTDKKPPSAAQLKAARHAYAARKYAR